MRLASCTLVVKGIINRWGVPLIYTNSQGPELARCGQVTLQEKLTVGGGVLCLSGVDISKPGTHSLGREPTALTKH